MTRLMTLAVALAALACPALGQFGDLPNLPGDPLAPAEPVAISVRPIASHAAVTPGQAFWVALEVTVAEGWAWYSPHPGPSVLGAEIRVKPEGLLAGPIRWPEPVEYVTEGLDFTNYVYKGRTIVYVPLKAPSDAAVGTILAPTFELGRQVCRAGACVNLDGPDAVEASESIAVAAEAAANPAWRDVAGGLDAARTAEQLRSDSAVNATVIGGLTGELGTWLMLLLAVAAGLTLNIMPCVLPVIPLRIYSIVNMAHEDRRRIVTLGLAFAFGIFLFFALLAVLNAAVALIWQSAYNWADMWQLRWVRVAMVSLLVIVAANLFGLFNVSAPKKVAQMEAAGTLTRKGGHGSSMSMGLMMAVLSTPCSFGLLLAVLGWAQTQPLGLATLVFLLIGVGMAAPHALLVAFPGLIQRLPRPGVWMEWFKQSMGFLLLLVAAWLISTFMQDPYAAWLMAFGVVLSFALWVWGTWVRYSDPLKRKIVYRGLAGALVVVAAIFMLRPAEDSGVKFQPFSRGELRQALDDGKPVLVKFTASWCLECKVVDRKVYRSEQVAEKLLGLGVVSLKADVSDRDSPASEYLRETFKGKSPPLTAVFLPGGEGPFLLTGTFDISDLYAVVEQAAPEVASSRAAAP